MAVLPDAVARVCRLVDLEPLLHQSLLRVLELKAALAVIPVPACGRMAPALPLWKGWRLQSNLGTTTTAVVTCLVPLPAAPQPPYSNGAGTSTHSLSCAVVAPHGVAPVVLPVVVPLLVAAAVPAVVVAALVSRALTCRLIHF